MGLHTRYCSLRLLAVIYDPGFSQQLRSVFFADLKDAEKLDAERWYKRSILHQFPEKLARLLSPSL